MEALTVVFDTSGKTPKEFAHARKWKGKSYILLSDISTKSGWNSARLIRKFGRIMSSYEVFVTENGLEIPTPWCDLDRYCCSEVWVPLWWGLAAFTLVATGYYNAYSYRGNDLIYVLEGGKSDQKMAELHPRSFLAILSGLFDRIA